MTVLWGLPVLLGYAVLLAVGDVGLEETYAHVSGPLRVARDSRM